MESPSRMEHGGGGNRRKPALSLIVWNWRRRVKVASGALRRDRKQARPSHSQGRRQAPCAPTLERLRDATFHAAGTVGFPRSAVVIVKCPTGAQPPCWHGPFTSDPDSSFRGGVNRLRRSRACCASAARLCARGPRRQSGRDRFCRIRSSSKRLLGHSLSPRTHSPPPQGTSAWEVNHDNRITGLRMTSSFLEFQPPSPALGRPRSAAALQTSVREKGIMQMQNRAHRYTGPYSSIMRSESRIAAVHHPTKKMVCYIPSWSRC